MLFDPRLARHKGVGSSDSGAQSSGVAPRSVAMPIGCFKGRLGVHSDFLQCVEQQFAAFQFEYGVTPVLVVSLEPLPDIPKKLSG